MGPILYEQAYLWSHCSLSTLSLLSRLKCSRDELVQCLWQEAKDAGVRRLDEAMVFGALAIQYLAEEEVKPKIGEYGYNWCYLLEKAWLVSRNEDDRRHVVIGWMRFLDVASQHTPLWYTYLSTENLQSRHGFQKQPSEENWQKCYAIAGLLVTATQERSEESYALSQQGTLNFAKGLKVTHPGARKAMFESALMLQNKAVTSFKTDEPLSHGIYYGHIAWNYSQLWEIQEIAIKQRLTYCNSAIEGFEKAIAVLGPSNGAWKGCCDNLARLYWARWKESYRDEDANHGVRVFEMILSQHPNDPHAQSGLGELCNQRADGMVMSNAQQRRESEKSLQLLENVIVGTAQHDVNLPSRLGKCSGVLKSRFAYDGFIQDIDVAIELQKTAIDLPQTRQSGLWFHYTQLSSYWRMRYHHSRISSDIKDAEIAARDAIQAAGETSTTKASGYEELACAQSVSWQFEVSRDPDVLDDAIKNFREAMSLRPNWRSVSLLRNLGAVLCMKFERGGGYQDASEGISLLREAVDILRRLKGKNNHSDESAVISILANALIKRYRRFSGKEDLNEAIRLLQNVLQTMDTDNVKSIDHVCDLCYALGLRYEISPNEQDAEEAQQRAEIARTYLRDSASPSDILRLENALGMVFLRKYNEKRDPMSIESAFDHFGKCLRPTSSPFDATAIEMRQAANSNLAEAYRMKAVTSKTDVDYLAAIQFYFRLFSEHQAQSTRPSESLFESLAEVALAKWKSSGGPRSKEARTAGHLARKAFCSLIEHESVVIARKIESAIEVAQLCYNLDKDLDEARRYSRLAIEGLTEATMPGISRVDHLRMIKRFSNLPSINLCFDILGGVGPEKALQEFERARTVIWNGLLSDASSVDDLELEQPELAARLSELRIHLGVPREPIARLDNERMRFTVPDCLKMGIEYNSLLAEIRRKRGFEDFLLTPSRIEALRELGCAGPIVVVNLTPWYSHAILIQSRKIENLELDVQELNGKDYYDGLVEALKRLPHHLNTATNILGQVMQLLWDRIAKPILDALGFQKRARGIPLPRMWWLTTGWLNVLPIHAAADFSDGPGGTITDSVVDRVVSSYVPNLRALAHARQRRDALLPSDPRTSLVVSMPETPGYKALPNASKEADEVMWTLTRYAACQSLDRPSRSQVLQGMRTASIVHFICHGISDQEDPTKSRLLLTDHARYPLDIRALHKTKFEHCALAYLSACETAITKDLALMDEGIHIADAILMAGVPSVIATWWEVVDEESVNVSRCFYEGLTEQGGTLDTSRSAEAIHRGVRELKDRGFNPFIWAAYVHFGV